MPTKIFFLLLLLLFTTFMAGEALQVNNLTTLEKLAPGSKKQIKLTLINDSRGAEQVDLKLVDYSCNSEGQHFFEEQAIDRSCVNWVTLGQERVTLAPGDLRNIYYTVQVPQSNVLSGSHWCVLLIEPAEKAVPKEPLEEGFHLSVKIRYAHHIVINIGETTPKLRILKKEVKAIGEQHYLVIHVLNEGELFFNPTITLKLYDKEGKLEHTLKSQPERLYPGNSQCFHLDLQEIPKNRLEEQLTGFLLFEGQNNILIGDRFTYP